MDVWSRLSEPVDTQQRRGASLSQISWHSHKSPWRTEARHGLTSLQPNAHTGLQRVWPLCLGLLKRKGNSRLVSALPGSLLTSRLVLHNWPYRVLECPRSACAVPMFRLCCAHVLRVSLSLVPAGMCPSHYSIFPFHTWTGFGSKK